MAIYIKTGMGTMPNTCLDCEALVHRKDMVKYCGNNRELVYESCSARKLGAFQALTHFACCGIEFEKSRPAWCPLIEIKEENK